MLSSWLPWHFDLGAPDWFDERLSRQSHGLFAAQAADGYNMRAERIETARGRKLATRIEPLKRFTNAEDYHQKYYLRNDRILMADFRAMFAEDSAFRESTAAARVNGFVAGEGCVVVLLKRLPDAAALYFPVVTGAALVAVGFLMMAHMIEPAALLAQAKRPEEALAEADAVLKADPANRFALDLKAPAARPG